MSDSDKYESKDPVSHTTTARVDEEIGTAGRADPLKKDLKGRHMQMIAIGGAIGAGLFIGSGSALSKGGPAALVIGYIVVGMMLLFTMQALAELAVLYPVNGAFYTYVVRFLDPSWGFAVGMDYAVAFLTVLPFELIAASITISFWREDLNAGIWVTLFLVVLCLIQLFGVRGYGEVEFVLSLVKIAACVGFIILGIIINTGAVGNQGYLGGEYWVEPGAFHNGFNGFCAVFVVASFAFGGTELVGLAAAESENPRKAIPRAAKQVFFRIFFFYVVNLFVLGLILPYTDPRLLHASGANSKASPFVLAIQDAGISVLPSIFNAVITVSVISVANACTFGSTRTLQAMAAHGMAPKILEYVDKQGRPVYCILLQLAFGLLTYIGLASGYHTIFDWLLSLSGLSWFFVWASICATHMRFEYAWQARGYNLKSIPYRPPLGVWGSVIGLFLNLLCMMATFYNALYPKPGAVPNATDFFQSYLAAFVVFALYLFWKTYTGDWSLYLKVEDMDLKTGLRMLAEEEGGDFKGPWWKRMVHTLF